jgi:hypothetical protein
MKIGAQWAAIHPWGHPLGETDPAPLPTRIDFSRPSFCDVAPLRETSRFRALA